MLTEIQGLDMVLTETNAQTSHGKWTELWVLHAQIQKVLSEGSNFDNVFFS